jgi:hypothetical protein
MLGDVVLFKSSGSWSDRLIEWATHGPYTHVGIDFGGNRYLWADKDGLKIHTGLGGRDTKSFRPPGTDIQAAIKWAGDQAGKEYGWLDIVSNSLRLVGLPVYIGTPGHWDCSDFVTRYLIVAEAEGPLGVKADDPELVSPNDIARAYGIK